MSTQADYRCSTFHFTIQSVMHKLIRNSSEFIQSRLHFGAVLLVGALLLAGCGGPPKNNPLLDDARLAVRTASMDSAVVTSAPEALDRAEVALRKGESLLKDGADREDVEHYAYMTSQYVAIAEETARLRNREQSIRRAEAERQQVVIEAREREVKVERQQAELARQQAEAERREAEAARGQAEDALERARELSERVRELEAEQTERGLVLTLSEVLFDVGKASLKEGGQRAVQQLATFLRDYPNRNVLVEGHTDNTGSLQLNLDLSKRRAEAVRTALLDMGISGDRIRTIGHGPEYPVVSNNTAAGRQQNRRVEIIISKDDGVIPDRREPGRREAEHRGREHHGRAATTAPGR